MIAKATTRELDAVATGWKELGKDAVVGSRVK